MTAVEKLEISLLGLISFDSEELRAKYKERIAKAKEMENQQQEEIGLMEIELKHTKTLLASCEKALEDRNKQDKKMYSEEDVRGMLEDMSRYVSTKEMRDNVVDVGYSEWVRKRDWFVNHLIKQFKNK
jgi:hypothetical protein